MHVDEGLRQAESGNLLLGVGAGHEMDLAFIEARINADAPQRIEPAGERPHHGEPLVDEHARHTGR